MKLTIELTPQQEALVDKLFETGLFGKSKQETVMRMIDCGLLETMAMMGIPIIELDNG